MPLFRSLDQRDWAGDLIADGIIAGMSSGSYTGVSALRNSDVLTAVSHIASNVARFPYVIKDEKTGDVID